MSSYGSPLSTKSFDQSHGGDHTLRFDLGGLSLNAQAGALGI
jgi:hypothetical protein